MKGSWKGWVVVIAVPGSAGTLLRAAEPRRSGESEGPTPRDFLRICRAWDLSGFYKCEVVGFIGMFEDLKRSQIGFRVVGVCTIVNCDVVAGFVTRDL